MILDPSYKEDVFESLASVPAIIKGLHKDGINVPSYVDAFVNALWISYQKGIQDYDMEPQEAAYHALCDAISNSASKKEEPQKFKGGGFDSKKVESDVRQPAAKKEGVSPMCMEEIIAGLEDLVKDRRSFFYPKPCDTDEIFRHDAAVLQAAIELLKEKKQNTQGSDPCVIASEGPLHVHTPLGTIVAMAAEDSKHPGMYIDLRRADFDQDMPLALIEYADDETDQHGKPCMITRVWGDGTDDSYTDRVVHQNIEDYFALDDEGAAETK